MESVAFFRNMNLGHAGSPGRATLLSAFADAGAAQARSFQSNGTVIFDAEDPAATAQHVRQLLSGTYDDAVMVRSLDRVEQIIADFPPVEAGNDHYRQMIVFYDRVVPGADALRAGGRDGLVQLLRVDADAVSGLIWKPKNTAGNMTAVVEAALALPCTARTLGTLQRLLKQVRGRADVVAPHGGTGRESRS